ncbi:MAG: hypothetical protein WB998_10120 [Solirubrobacteraceae bacterium]
MIAVEIRLPKPTEQRGSSPSRPPVANVHGERKVEHLDRLEPEGLDSVEQPLARPEQGGDHVEREFVDHSGAERLTNSRGGHREGASQSVKYGARIT